MTAMAAALYVAHTGNVLGVATRTGDPLGELAAADLAGAAFPVIDGDSGDVLVEVEASELAVLNVPLIDDLLLNPQECSIDDQSKTAQHEPASPSISAIQVTGTKLQLTLSAKVLEKTPAWAQLETGTGSNRRRIVLSGEIAANESSVSFDTTLAGGDYDVLALVRGHLPRTDTQHI